MAMMNYAMKHRNIAHTWSKVLLVVSFGKVFVAGAGLGLAMLGVVDIAGALGVRPLVEFIERERILDIFAFGGGLIATLVQIAWKFVGR
jgi:hypothetical protein